MSYNNTMTTTKVNGKMTQYPKTYKVVGHDGDGIPFWRVVEVICGMELYSQGMSRNKQEMIDLAEKLNKEAAE